MRGRVAAVGLGVLLHLSSASAQYQPAYPPPAQYPGAYTPGSPVPPGSPMFPQPVAPPGVVAPGSPTPQPGAAVLAPADVPLPYPEQKFPIDAGTISARRVGDSWQVWAGPRLLKEV